MSDFLTKLPIKRGPRYSAGHTNAVFGIYDINAGSYVFINGKCGWLTRGAARNALSHLIGAEHDRERFEIQNLLGE